VRVPIILALLAAPLTAQTPDLPPEAVPELPGAGRPVAIDAHQGRVVDTAGDGVLAAFEIVGGAVQAASEIQKALTDRNGPLPESRRMRFPIGVTLGEVIEKDDGTVYGDGLNVAA